MKERTKQILRYVACGLGGLALGIGLLGGLSMCATSGNNQTDEVNTILATRKNAPITTTQGGYSGYQFAISPDYPTTLGKYYYKTFSVDLSTYSLSWLESGGGDASNTSSFVTFVSNEIETLRPLVPANTLYFLAVFGYADYWGASSSNAKLATYLSFVPPSSQGVRGYAQTSFILKSGYSYQVLTDLHTLNTLDNQHQVNNYIITTEASNTFLLNVTSTTTYTTDFVFQDVGSYYKELGYTSGHQTGYADGYEAGENHAYENVKTGIAFETYGMYANATFNVVADRTVGSFSYMDLFDYITDDYQERLVYVLFIRSSSTNLYSGYVVDAYANESDYGTTYEVATFDNVSSISNVQFTPLLDRHLFQGAYITSFHGRGLLVNEAFWFSGGTYEASQQIYKDGYDEGYEDGTDDGYILGYERGQEVGDAEGYSRGYTEGFNQTNTKNVFSLFTSAFDSVASFFNLKIFGFLPLYWFFLAPLFIALISLLMRMVKH